MMIVLKEDALTMTLTPEKLNLQSTPLSEDKQTALKALVPEAFVTGELDINTLLAALGMADDDNDDAPPKKEAYGLNWAGKAQARQQARKGTNWTLAPAPEDEESVNFETTQNLLIEADNLVALKLLKKGYTGKIDLIYIDPPYNVDADTVYKDDYTESVKAYEQRSGKRDDAGNLLDTFKDKGHKHSQWLNMMYPRLQLLKQLLKQGGVIFVSIDDGEVANLRLLMDEIFGEDNFAGKFIVNSTPNARDYGHIGKMHDFILMYSKEILATETNLIPQPEKVFKYQDKDGGFNIHPLYNSNEAFTSLNRPNLFYPFYLCTDTKTEDGFYSISLEKQANSLEIFPPQSLKNKIQFVWRWGRKKASEFINTEIVGYRTESGEYRIVQKMRHSEKMIRSILLNTAYSNRSGTTEVENLFNQKIFNFPKSLTLLHDLIYIATKRDSLILDCFAGSGTTGHATMKLNAEDGGNRQYICVQLPEKLDPKNKNQATACEFLDSIAKPRTIA